MKPVIEKERATTTREERLAAREAAWRERWEAQPKRDIDFTTTSSMEVEPLYTPGDLEGNDFDRDIGFPGEYPYTRGVYDSMYRTRLWTMRQFAGFATAEETNQRYHFLLEHGQTGLSVAFDLPTLMGYDSDHPMSEGEVGVCGVAIDSLADMETLFDRIPLDQVSTSMTINGPAIIFLALYVAVAEKQGIAPERLRGTLQTDILKEYIAQKEWLFPPAPHLKIIVDMMAWCAEKAPLWHPISISGYHIREAGSTAVQELAFTLADGFTYVEEGIAAGLDVDRFAPRLSFFWNSHNDFFEEVAKYRAARRIWARHMKERYGAND
ncbi:MAG TPA: methylmalonyl-CoA mutase family protein, partial [Gemmatimonadota bacterium]|nr:methylmalonyl-CoA mutase family protein [Gemmatimonadota bacterium]